MKLSHLEQQIIIKALLGLIDNACLYQVEDKIPGKTRHEQVPDMVDKLGQGPAEPITGRQNTE